GCINDNSPTREEYNKLQEALEICKSENEDLKNTPERRLLEAQRLEEEGELSSARGEYQALFKLYPKTTEGIAAEKEVSRLDKEIEQQKIAAEKEKNKTFKNIKEELRFTENDLTFSFSSVQVGKNWVTNRYENRYFIS